MKKFILTLAFGLLCAVGFAQDYVIVNQGTAEHKFLLKEVNAITHTNGNTVNIVQSSGTTSYLVADVDSITFVDAEEHVIPGGFDPLEPYIPIYDGDTPPNIEGCYLNSPNVLVYSSLSWDSPGSTYADRVFRFINQDMVNNTIDYQSYQGGAYEESVEAFVTGKDNNFTVFFNVTGTNESGSTYRMAKILSGTISEQGIINLYYGFYMVDKNDPYNEMVEVGTIRVFKDNDGMSNRTNWNYSMKANTNDNLPADMDK